MNSTPQRVQPRICVVGVGGAGCNAVMRMAAMRPPGVRLLGLNTDVQALASLRDAATFAIGPETTGGMGSGGNPETGRKAIKESQPQVAQLLAGWDLVFVTAGLGGGTGTGAAPVAADVARRRGALVVGVVTLPFSFEGIERRAVAERGLDNLRQKVDTLMVVENDRLLSSLGGSVTLERAFRMADEVLRQGVRGISDVINVPGLINVDFADVRAILLGGGAAYMATGEGEGKDAVARALDAALSNPLFDAPLGDAKGILLNVRGGKDLSLAQVQEVARVLRQVCAPDATVILGLAQDKKWSRRVGLTLVATGLRGSVAVGRAAAPPSRAELVAVGTSAEASLNGHQEPRGVGVSRLL